MAVFEPIGGLAVFTLGVVVLLASGFFAGSIYLSWSPQAWRYWVIVSLPIGFLFVLTSVLVFVTTIASNQAVGRVTGN